MGREKKRKRDVAEVKREVANEYPGVQRTKASHTAHEKRVSQH